MDRERLISAAAILAENLGLPEETVAERLMESGLAVDEAYRLIAFLPSAFSRPVLEDLGVSVFSDTVSVATPDGGAFDVRLTDQPEYVAALALARDHRKVGVMPNDVFVAIAESSSEVDAVSNALNESADIKSAVVALALANPEHAKHVFRAVET